MKKTCEGCRALSLYPMRCDLGKKIKIKTINDINVSAKPLEECPKPRTIKEYICLMRGGRE